MNIESVRSDLAELRHYFDQRADVLDGPEGQPVANTAMSMLSTVDRIAAALDALPAEERPETLVDEYGDTGVIEQPQSLRSS